MEKYDIVGIGGGMASYGFWDAIGLGLDKFKKKGLGNMLGVSDDFPTCQKFGCSPKKLMRIQAQATLDAGVKVDQEIYSRARETMFRETEPVGLWAPRNGVDYLEGKVEFTGMNSILVRNKYGEEKEIQAQKFILASGSRPRKLDIPGNEYILDSRDVFSRSKLDKLPRKVVVLGGGYIASELAHLYSVFSKKGVDLIHRSQMLKGFHSGLVEKLIEDSERNLNLRYHFWENVLGVEKLGKDSYLVSTDKGNYNADVVVGAIGRVANTKGLGLKVAGIEVDKRGGVIADKHMRTSNRDVYACGDVVGFIKYDDGREVKNMMLTPVGGRQVQYIMRHLLGDEKDGINQNVVATTAFTIPEIGSAVDYSVLNNVVSEEKALWNRELYAPFVGEVIHQKNSEGRVIAAHVLGRDAVDEVNSQALKISGNAIMAYPSRSYVDIKNARDGRL